jgi:hypothetical protein
VNPDSDKKRILGFNKIVLLPSCSSFNPENPDSDKPQAKILFYASFMR